jgi:hypothetical protein
MGGEFYHADIPYNIGGTGLKESQRTHQSWRKLKENGIGSSFFSNGGSLVCQTQRLFIVKYEVT